VWPNWVDLVVVTIFLRACYGGFGRGFLGECLLLLGLVTATAFACNWHTDLAQFVLPWWWGDPALLELMVYFGLFVGLLFAAHLLTRKITDFVQWGRLHWLLESLGILLGAVRGLWWGGIVLLTLLSLGIPYLSGSVLERSVLGPHLLELGRPVITSVVDRYPGHLRRTTLMPAVTLRLPRLLQPTEPRGGAPP